MRALSGDVALLQGLHDRRLCGLVHSVFERVVNVEDDAGELFTLATSDLDNAPDTLIVDTARFPRWGIRCGDRVDSLTGAITIAGRVGIRLDRAWAWHAALPAYPADDARLKENVRAVRTLVAPRAFGAADAANSAFTSKMPMLIERRAGMLRAALSAGDIEAAARHGTALIGLGPGLTPSGDDFLVGLFAVLHMPRSPCCDLAGVCASIAAHVAERTNAISSAALKAAARGRVRQSVIALMHALVEDSRDSVAAALSRVLAIGSTSGADMVAGMLDGLDIAAGRRSSRPSAAAVKV